MFNHFSITSGLARINLPKIMKGDRMLENKVEFDSKTKMTNKEIYKRIGKPPEYRSGYDKLHPYRKEVIFTLVNRSVELRLPGAISDSLLSLAIALISDPAFDCGLAENVFQKIEDRQRHNQQQLNIQNQQIRGSIAREILEFEEVEAFKEKNAQYINYDPDYYDEY
jgi:hypothetical protein